jgi:hypothetical protein
MGTVFQALLLHELEQRNVELKLPRGMGNWKARTLLEGQRPGYGDASFPSPVALH